MRCKRCNAILKRDGDLCTNCLKEIQKEKILEEDNKQLLKVKKKYSPKYILTKELFEVYLIFLILIGFSIYAKGFLQVFFYAIILLLIIFGVLVVSKKNAKNNYIIFYETKVVFEGKVFFSNTKRVIAYEDIKDIVFTQGSSWFERFFQRMFNLGNIYVYTKKGNIISNGIRLEIVDNFKKVMEDINNVVGDKLR